jgi:hypothetical protein
MSTRKRKSGKESTQTPSGVSDDPATAVAEPPVEGVAEPPTAEAKPEDQGFADKVAQKKWVPAPDPFGIAGDNLAGVYLFESKQDRQMAIKFGEGRPEDKPSAAVITLLKEAGYRWNPSDRIWVHPVRQESAMGTRIEAEWLYQEVRQIIRQEKGIEPGQEIPR